ncbi:MAG: hypothetical protein WBC19_13410 [Pyrinomonadaceae bacterium]|nr:hypothetical protein [Chloracidobacterium sp.]
MEPIDKLKQLTAWDIEPTLTEDDLDELLAVAALKDADGLTPEEAEWTPTYDLNTAAAQAWLIKAARAAAMVDTPEAGMVTSKVFDNCRAMARIYASKRTASVSII